MPKVAFWIFFVVSGVHSGCGRKGLAVHWHTSAPLIRPAILSNMVGVAPAIEPAFDAESGLLAFFLSFRVFTVAVDARGWLYIIVHWHTSAPLIRPAILSSTVGVAPAIEPAFDAESGLLAFFLSFRVFTVACGC